MEAASRMPNPDEVRPDFMAMSGGSGRMDAMPQMKPGPGWEADEATRLKSSMGNRDKMVSFFCSHFATVLST